MDLLHQNQTPAKVTTIEFPDDDDHALFCATASISEGEEETDFVFTSAPGDEPSWNKALTGPDCKKWLTAQDVEVEKLDSLHTFDVVSTLTDVNIVPTHYVCKRKHNAKGKIEKYKVQLLWVDTSKSMELILRKPSLQ